MPDLPLDEVLEALFRETGKAHHDAFVEVDGADADWPIWYAGYLVDKIGVLLDAKLTKSDLVYLLMVASKEQPIEAPGSDWARYYARFFAERYS